MVDRGAGGLTVFLKDTLFRLGDSAQVENNPP